MKVLLFIDYYLPGYRAGGATKSIAGLVELLGDQYQFFIITRDRDLDMDYAYPSVKVDSWTELGPAKVYYASPSMFSIRGFIKVIKSIDYDVVYLNSFFSPHTTGRILLLRELGLIKPSPVIVAPRGEFSIGAIKLKRRKKQLYLFLFKTFVNIKKYLFQASTQMEADDIKRTLFKGDSDLCAKKVVVAVDCLSGTSTFATLNNKSNMDASGCLKIVFLSRIAPKKNLDYLLDVLTKTASKVSLSIYGPLEVPDYWTYCKGLIARLPENVLVEYRGDIHSNNVINTFAQHDVFFFPTRGENFGHVIFEALLAGTCVVLSDQTPWEPDEKGAVERISLDESQVWAQAVEKWAHYSQDTLSLKRKAATEYAENYCKSESSKQANISLFERAMTDI